MKNLLREQIEKHTIISDEDFEVFFSFFELKNIKRKEYVLKAGTICDFEGFVTKGCFKVYYLNGANEEHVLNFAIEDWWIVDLDSFINQAPARLNIVALENSEVLVINKINKELAFEKLPVIEKMFRVLSQKALVALHRRMLSATSKNAEERYIEFSSKYPQLVNRVASKHIASHLGISGEFLSKIKKRIAKR
ncbi:Crp/Fnr family transcriptional regulator [Flavobacterium collinsii]|nr:Crp/Fnr family transcriptional regulator [Flavobacterium collinsii]